MSPTRTSLTLTAVLGFLGACAATPPPTSPSSSAAAGVPLTFAVVGDTGYIPAYDHLDDDGDVLRTVPEYLAEERKAWTKRNNPLDDFRPTPMTFESSLGSFVPASGLYPVAWAVEKHCAAKSCDFALMLGDNIYPDGATLGADGVADARRFRDMLDRPYGQLGAGVDDFAIYAMMGNHDWRISREATMSQVLYLQQHPNFYMPGLFYRASPPASRGSVEIFVVDTEVLLASTTVFKDKLAKDGSGREVSDDEIEAPLPHTIPQTDAERNMVAWLDEALRTSTARWKIVAGHHALWSGGGSKFEKARALRKLLLPSLCRYADAYVAGDDHLLEVYTDDCRTVEGSLPGVLPMLVSGAGAKQRPKHAPFVATQVATYPQLQTLWSRGMVWGFMHFTLADDELLLQVISTPPDFSGTPVVEDEFRFARRSGGGATQPRP